MTRAKMPERRIADTRELEFGNMRFTISVGVYPDGRPGEVFDSRSAKSIAGGQHHATAFRLKTASQLSDRGGFADAIDPDRQNHERFFNAIE